MSLANEIDAHVQKESDASKAALSMLQYHAMRPSEKMLIPILKTQGVINKSTNNKNAKNAVNKAAKVVLPTHKLIDAGLTDFANRRFISSRVRF